MGFVTVIIVSALFALGLPLVLLLTIHWDTYASGSTRQPERI